MHKKLILVSLVLITLIGAMFFYRYYAGSKKIAVQKSVRWLLAQQNNMSDHSAAWNYRKLYQVTTDQKLATQLEKIIREKEAIETLQTKDYSQLNTLAEITVYTEELLKRKCLEKPYQEEALQLEKHISNNWSHLFPSSQLPIERIVDLYLINALGIDNTNFYQKTISDTLDHTTTNEDFISYMYGITHIIFTKSDYYGHYLNWENFPQETLALNKALESYVDKPNWSDIELDIVAEILCSLKLLQYPIDENFIKAQKRLVKLQNTDGTWGQASQTQRARLHHTVVATLALMDFREDIPENKIYCPLFSTTYRL